MVTSLQTDASVSAGTSYRDAGAAEAFFFFFCMCRTTHLEKKSQVLLRNNDVVVDAFTLED